MKINLTCMQAASSARGTAAHLYTYKCNVRGVPSLLQFSMHAMAHVCTTHATQHAHRCTCLRQTTRKHHHCKQIPASLFGRLLRFSLFSATHSYLPHACGGLGAQIFSLSYTHDTKLFNCRKHNPQLPCTGVLLHTTGRCTAQHICGAEPTSTSQPVVVRCSLAMQGDTMSAKQQSQRQRC